MKRLGLFHLSFTLISFSQCCRSGNANCAVCFSLLWIDFSIVRKIWMFAHSVGNLFTPCQMYTDSFVCCSIQWSDYPIYITFNFRTRIFIGSITGSVEVSVCVRLLAFLCVSVSVCVFMCEIAQIWWWILKRERKCERERENKNGRARKDGNMKMC